MWRNDVSKQLFVFIFMVIQESTVSCKAECEAHYVFLTFMKSQINQAKPSELSRETVIPRLECVKDDKSGRVETD